MSHAFSTILVAGAGAWGTALALLLERSGRNVVLWTRNEDVVATIERTRINEIYLPGVLIPPSIRVTTNREVVSDVDAMLCVIPTQYLRHELPAFAAARGQAPLPVALCCKGIERGTGQFVHDILAEVWPSAQPALVSGPSFASDVAAGLPTAVTLADADAARATQWQEALSSQTFRPYVSADLQGVAIGGAVKNVLAIGCGVVEGCGLGESAKAALMARGFAEILRFTAAMGGQAETLHGLSGLGDIILTCSSRQSRNFSLGYALGQGSTIDEIMAGRHTVAEGAATAPILVHKAQEAGVDMPVAEAVAALVTGQATAAETIAQLMARPLKSGE